MFFTKPINLRFNPPVTWASIKETRKLYVLCVSIELQKNFFLPYFDGHCRLKWNNVRFSQKWKKNFRMNFDIVRIVLKTILTWNGLTGYAKRRLFSGNFRHRIKRTVSLERISAILCALWWLQKRQSNFFLHSRLGKREKVIKWATDPSNFTHIWINDGAFALMFMRLCLHIVHTCTTNEEST